MNAKTVKESDILAPQPQKLSNEWGWTAGLLSLLVGEAALVLVALALVGWSDAPVDPMDCGATCKCPREFFCPNVPNGPDNGYPQ